MLINKIDEDEEEGFFKDKEMIEINYKFMSNSIPKLIRKSPFSKKTKSNKKQLHSFENIKASPFINQNIREQVLGDILKKHKKSIIFNGFNQNQITYVQPNIAFQANFPMGNLQIVTRVKSCHYDMYMRPDTNTEGNFQWFYFRVYVKKRKKIKFTIRNFIKSTMLYSKGLRPFYISKNERKEKYQQIKQQVQFQQDQQTQYFNLTFSFQFQYDNDQVYFCSQPPYGYNNLEKAIEKLNNCKKYFIGKTILGNKIPYLVVNENLQPKVIGIVIARQHPGETVGSWMMEGFMNEVNRLKFSSLIRWIIIPMINIDGVELGNNRTGVLGYDFNRNWNIEQNSRKQKMFPQITSILKYIRMLKRKYPKKVKMFLDLHGHSSQQNVFTYGPQHAEKTQSYYLSRMFPEILAKKNESFKLSQSSYSIHQDKKNAARSVVLNEFKIPFTYTIQCTFGVMNDKRVTSDQMIKIGEDIAISANEFIQNVYLKDTTLNNNILLNSIKEKYSNMQNIQGELEEYDTASQKSKENVKRKQFEKNIQSLLSNQGGEQKEMQKNKRILRSQTLDNKIGIKKMVRKISQSNSILHVNSFIDHQQLNSSVQYTKQSKRVVTEGSNPMVYDECAYFPPIKNRSRVYEKGIVNRFHSSSTTVKQQKQTTGMMNMREIQQRLFKLRNSKIGKKILVINAYGV